MQYATFLNFTEKPFTAHWNGKPYTFKPGQKKVGMPDGVAQTFAKHLANQVLTEAGKEVYCSPKKPLQVPEFMNLFNQAYFPEGVDGEDIDSDIGISPDEQPSMNVEMRKRQKIDPYDANANTDFGGPGEGAQVVGELEADDTDDYTPPADEEVEKKVAPVVAKTPKAPATPKTAKK